MICVIFSLFLIPVNKAHADSLSFPTAWFDPSVNQDQYQNYFEALQQNERFAQTYPEEYVVMISAVTQNQVRVMIMQPNYDNITTVYDSAQGYTYKGVTGKYSYNENVPPSLLSSYTFTTSSEITWQNNTNWVINAIGIRQNDNVPFFGALAPRWGTTAYWGQQGYPVAVFSGTNLHPYDPIIDPLYESTYRLYINDQEFVEWLINTGRYTEINARMMANHVSGTVESFESLVIKVSFVSFVSGLMFSVSSVRP